MSRVWKVVLIAVVVFVVLWALLALLGSGSWSDPKAHAATRVERLTEQGRVASIQTTSATYPAYATRGRCWTKQVWKTLNNKFGWRLATIYIKKSWCSVRGAIYYAPRAEAGSSLSGLAVKIGYDDSPSGAIEEFYPWRAGNIRSGHRSWRQYRFKQCIPGVRLLGCVNNSKVPISIRAHADGGWTAW